MVDQDFVLANELVNEQTIIDGILARLGLVNGQVVTAVHSIDDTTVFPPGHVIQAKSKVVDVTAHQTVSGGQILHSTAFIDLQLKSDNPQILVWMNSSSGYHTATGAGGFSWRIRNPSSAASQKLFIGSTSNDVVAYHPANHTQGMNSFLLTSALNAVKSTIIKVELWNVGSNFMHSSFPFQLFAQEIAS